MTLNEHDLHPPASDPPAGQASDIGSAATPPRVILIMGVSGVGKSTLGQLLADRLRWELLEGDDFHPAENVRKMESGIPLDDEDRKPWLERLRRIIDRRRDAGIPVIVTCSALKEEYRRQLGFPDPEMALVFPTATVELINERLRGRRGHFMPPSLLRSQLDTLEPPSQGALQLDAQESPAQLAEKVIERLGLRP